MMMMAMMMVASATAFAGDSDALKAVMKSKNYAEAAQLLKQNIDQMANAAEKAKAYNYLVDLSMKKINKETGTIMENQVGRQMGRAESEIVPYDTLGLVDAICDALNDAVECNKYDQQPDAKGKIKPKFAEKNAQRIWPVRIHLVNEKEYFGQLAFFAGRYAYDQGDMDAARRYIAIAKNDPKEKENAINLELFTIRHNLKSHADSVNAINQMKAMYEADPENDAILDALNGMYDAIKDKAAQTALLDNHLAKYPNSFAALANKGLMAMTENDAVKGAEWLRKAAVAKPDNPVVYTYLGICLSSLAANSEADAKAKEYYKQAIEAFDKAKELDPDKQQCNWGYNRYQAYYGLYGEEDPRTKAAEADR